MATLQVSRVAATTVVPSTPSSKLQVSRVSVGGSITPVENKLQIARVRVSASVANTAPVVSVDQPTATFDPGSDALLRGFDSSNTGTIQTRNWRLQGGNVLTSADSLPLRVPVVAQDTVLTYVYTATDNAGLTSTVSSVVTVRKAPFIRKNADGSFTGFVLRDAQNPANGQGFYDTSLYDTATYGA